jgi:hypothetical protein
MFSLDIDSALGTISTKVTLSDRINNSKYNANRLKSVIDVIADLLLDDTHSAVAPDSKEVNEACDRIIELLQKDYAFYETLKKVLHGFLASENLSNADNLKYILKKYRFYHHFLHTHSDADRVKHINILHQVLKEIEITEIPAEIDKNAAEKLRKQVFEKVALEKFNIYMTHTSVMILSKYWPINEEDYATLEPIPSENLAFVRSGHHYDWPSIIKYSKIRRSEYPQGIIPETTLFAYNTREKFNDIDAHHILRVSGKYPDSIPFDLLFRLYELQFLARVNEIRNELYTAPGYRSTEIDDYRLASINRQDQNRLINTAKKYNESVDFDGMQIAKNEFISKLRSLIAGGLSLEEFASLSTEMQEAKIFPDRSLPEWIIEEELSDKGFSFKSTRANSNYCQAKIIRSGHCISICLNRKDNMDGASYGISITRPTEKSFNDLKDFLIKTANINEPELISRLEKLIKMVEETLPAPVPAIPQTHTSFLSTNHYRREHISEVIRTNIGDEALSKYFSIRPQITMQEYYAFLRQSQAMKQEIHTLLQERPNDDRLANDRQKLEAIEKLKNLLDNPAVWQHEQFTKMTHIVVRNLINLIKDERQPSNNNRPVTRPF